jgi:hypothetical protein
MKKRPPTAKENTIVKENLFIPGDQNLDLQNSTTTRVQPIRNNAHTEILGAKIPTMALTTDQTTVLVQNVAVAEAVGVDGSPAGISVVCSCSIALTRKARFSAWHSCSLVSSLLWLFLETIARSLSPGATLCQGDNHTFHKSLKRTGHGPASAVTAITSGGDFLRGVKSTAALPTFSQKPEKDGARACDAALFTMALQEALWVKPNLPSPRARLRRYRLLRKCAGNEASPGHSG